MNAAKAFPSAYMRDMLRNTTAQWKNLFFVGFFVILLTPQFYESLGNGVVLALYSACFLWGIVKRTRLPSSAVFGLVFFAVATVYAILGISTAAWGNYFKILVFYTFPFVADVFLKNISQKDNRWILTALLLVCLYNTAYNIVLNLINPLISAQINFTSAYDYLHPGGTLFAFQLLLVLMVLIPFWRYGRHKGLMMTTLVVSFACLLIFQRAIFIGAFVLFLLLYILFRRKTSKTVTVVKCLCIGTMLILSLIFLDKLLLLLIQIMPDDRVKIRLIGTYQFITSGVDDTSSFSNRWNLYMAAFHTFTGSLKNFLAGVGYHTDSVDYAYLLTVGGTGHSEILDIAARFGLLGLIPAAGFFISLGRELKAKYRAVTINRMNVGIMINIWLIVMLCCAVLSGIEYFGAIAVIAILPRLVLNETIAARGLDAINLRGRGGQ